MPIVINTPPKTFNEKETRRRLLNTADRLGCKPDVERILQKYDRAIAKCTNEKERQCMAECGIAEIHHLLDCHGSLEVNGKTIVKATE